MKDQVNNPGEQLLHYIIKKCKTQGVFDIIDDISENVTLIQLMDSIVNINHEMSIVGYWIFDSFKKRRLC